MIRTQSGHLRGGYSQQSANGHQQHRERLWFSPQCLTADAVQTPAPSLADLWDEEE